MKRKREEKEEKIEGQILLSSYLFILEALNLDIFLGASSSSSCKIINKEKIKISEEDGKMWKEGGEEGRRGGGEEGRRGGGEEGREGGKEGRREGGRHTSTTGSTFLSTMLPEKGDGAIASRYVIFFFVARKARKTKRSRERAKRGKRGKGEKRGKRGARKS